MHACVNLGPVVKKFTSTTHIQLYSSVPRNMKVICTHVFTNVRNQMCFGSVLLKDYIGFHIHVAIFLFVINL
jgi:hypothetical protein